MITETDGDLSLDDVDALVNTVNTVGVIGKGIALQFKRAFPDNFAAYAAACKQGQAQVARMFVVPNQVLTGPRWIINFPTEEHWKGRSRIEWVRDGLDDLVRTIEKLGLQSIAVPPLGAGNGGLDWLEVRDLIRLKLPELADVDIAPVPTGHRPSAYCCATHAHDMGPRHAHPLDGGVCVRAGNHRALVGQLPALQHQRYRRSCTSPACPRPR